MENQIVHQVRVVEASAPNANSPLRPTAFFDAAGDPIVFGGGGSSTELKMAGRYYKTGLHTYANLTETATAGSGWNLNAAGLASLQLYLPTGSEADSNTGGYKFTPTESGLLQVALDYKVAQNSGGGNIATGVSVEIASDDYNDFSGFRRLGEDNIGNQVSFHASAFIDIAEWAGDKAVGVLFNLSNKEAVNSIRLAYAQWQVFWTPMPGINTAFTS